MDTREALKQGEDKNAGTSWKTILLIQFLVITTISITVSFTYLGAFPFDRDLGIYRILPGDILFDFIWLYVFSGILGLVLYFITPALTGVFLKLHKILIGKNSKYYLQDIEPNSTSSGQIRRFLLPAFTALGISYSIANNASIVNAIVVMESFEDLALEAQTILVSLSLLFILLLVSCFIMLLFVPIWTLQDVGLVRESERKPGVISETEGVGNWYLKLVKGFAGISTLVAYIFTIFQTIEWYQFVLQSPPEGGFSILIFLIPVAAVAVAPILALGPISFVYIFYMKSNARDLSTYQKWLE